MSAENLRDNFKRAIFNKKYGCGNEASGGLWKPVESSRSLWKPWEAFGGFWRPLETSASLWKPLEAFGGIKFATSHKQNLNTSINFATVRSRIYCSWFFVQQSQDFVVFRDFRGFWVCFSCWRKKRTPESTENNEKPRNPVTVAQQIMKS